MSRVDVDAGVLIADELGTTERPDAPIQRVTRMKIVTIHMPLSSSPLIFDLSHCLTLALIAVGAFQSLTGSG